MVQLREILNDFAKNIEDFVRNSEGKVVVFDFDGTLTKFKYDKDRLLPCLQNEVQQYTIAGGNIYKDVRVLKLMQYIVGQIGENNVWVLTTSYPELRERKSEIINEAFGIPLGKIIHSDNDMHKIELLKDIHNKENKKIVFVEDTVYTLMAAEDNWDFVEGFHISSLLP